MDPTACLKLILDSLVSEDRNQAIMSLGDLTEWLDGDGWMPAVLMRRDRSADIDFYYMPKGS